MWRRCCHLVASDINWLEWKKMTNYHITKLAGLHGLLCFERRMHWHESTYCIFTTESAGSQESIIAEHACQVQDNCVFSSVKQWTPLHMVVCRVSKVEMRGRCHPLEMDVLRSAVGRIMSTSIRQRSSSRFRKNRGPLKCVSISCPSALCCGCFCTVSTVPYECSGCLIVITVWLCHVARRMGRNVTTFMWITARFVCLIMMYLTAERIISRETFHNAHDSTLMVVSFVFIISC